MNRDKLIIQGRFEVENHIHYEVDPQEQPIGVGGSGTVRRGLRVDESTGLTREVAIKFLYDDLNQSAIDRSRREASIHIIHENLVEMLGFVQVGEPDMYGKNPIHYHVISEYLDGVMLSDVLNGVSTGHNGVVYPAVERFVQLLGTNRIQFAVEIVRGVLSGLMALHDNGYIHRDIDPSNIMITKDGKIKLIDLGIAKRLRNLTNQDGHTMMGQFIGKAYYAAPEQVRGDISSQDQTTDIYAIGVMLFQLVTGTLPFLGTTEEILDKQVNGKMPLSKIPDKQLRKIIGKATEKKQKDRYMSAAEFRVGLDKYWNGNATLQSTIGSFDPYSTSNVQGTVVSSLSSSSTVIIPGATTTGNGTYVPRPIDNRSNQQNIWIWAASALAGLIVGVILHFVI